MESKLDHSVNNWWIYPYKENMHPLRWYR